MDSKMKPLWIVYNNKLLGGDTVDIIFKNGDGEGETARVLDTRLSQNHITVLYKSLFFRPEAGHVDSADFEVDGSAMEGGQPGPQVESVCVKLLKSS